MTSSFIETLKVITPAETPFPNEITLVVLGNKMWADLLGASIQLMAALNTRFFQLGRGVLDRLTGMGSHGHDPWSPGPGVTLRGKALRNNLLLPCFCMATGRQSKRGL